MNYDERVAAVAAYLPGATATGWRLFALLRPGWVTTHDQILTGLWPDQPSRSIMSIGQVVKRLRPHLPDGVKIMSVKGIGFRLDVPPGWRAPWRQPAAQQDAALADLVSVLAQWAERHGVRL